MLLLDTWAWVEYFKGTAHGARVGEVLAREDTVATSILTVAELGDLHFRDGRPALEERISFIASRGRLLEVTRAVAEKAGRTKWAQRRRKRAMGLGDAIIYETAQAEGLTVLTGDPGFKGLPGVEFLG